MPAYTLEIAANSLASALAAQDGGADRVELCENLGEGGCTPSFATIALAREKLRIPLYVLVRPRGGDFAYSPLERELMLRDVGNCARLGVDGVAIGALDANGDVDVALCRELIVAAGKLGVTFHRAFDACREPPQALERIVELGCERVLTSGASGDALAGAANIAQYVRDADSRIAIMAGAGVTPENIGELKKTGVREFHASARALQRGAAQRALPGLSAEHWQSDARIVRALRRALDD